MPTLSYQIVSPTFSSRQPSVRANSSFRASATLSASNMSPPRIAIVGAGPSGLTLARILHHTSPGNPSFVVFEKDASAKARQMRGGTLDLHEDTGLAAIEAAELRDHFLKHARYEGQDMVMTDHECNHFMQVSADDFKKNGWPERPEIDREILRGILLDSIPTEFIKWGRRLRLVSPDGMLTFDDGTEGPFELIVGSDGAFSKVRPLLTGVQPGYAGVSGYEFRLRRPDLHPKISEMVGRGSYFAFSKGQSMVGQRLGHDEIMFYAWFLKPEKYIRDMIAECGGDVPTIKEKLLAQFSRWVPAYLDWIKAADEDSFRPWPLFELPVGDRWEHKKGFTLIGDAAHLMTPFAGEGVNAAMGDSLDLAQAIVETLKSGGGLDDAVKKYEEGMFPRAERLTGKTMENKIVLFQPDAPKGIAEKFSTFLSD